MSAVPNLLRSLLAPLSSLKLSVVLLVLLALLTWLGTLYQVDHGLFEAQGKYFDSLWLVHEVPIGDSTVPLPLPGGMLVMGVLFVNLMIGGILRLRRGWATAGVLVTHLGIVLLLVAGMIKTVYAVDGHVTLFEGQRSDRFESYYRYELVVHEESGDGTLKEHVAPQEAFEEARGANPVRIASPALPFDVEVRHYSRNSRVMPKGPMFEAATPVVDGFFLKEEPPATEAEANVAGLYATAVERSSGARQEVLVWGAETQPATVQVGGKRYGIGLRHESYAMPFTIALDDFVKEDHPRISMAKSFSSDVKVIEDGSERAVKISMNEPLRAQGLVVYQASWGPSNARPGDPLFSSLAVVQNPADQYPLYACIVIAIGLSLHFSRKLIRYMRSEASKQPTRASSAPTVATADWSSR